MLHANELKSGAVFLLNGAPHLVESVFKQTPSARGGATLYKIRARNLLTRTKSDQTCRGDDAFPEAHITRRPLQYLYRDGDLCQFLDTETFDQLPFGVRELEAQLPYLADGLEGITGLVLDERLVAVELPDAVEMTLVECDPSIRGATASARTKPAKTQTGLTIQVPEYMEKGEIVRVDTRDGRFLGRA
jgi:elongation factor P